MTSFLCFSHNVIVSISSLSLCCHVCRVSWCFSDQPTLYTVQGFLVFGFLSPTHSLYCASVSWVSCVSQPHPPLYCLCFWGLLCFSALCVSGLLCFLYFSALYTVCVSGVSCVSQPFIQSVYRGFLCFLCFSAPPTVYTVCVSGVSCVSCVSQPFIQSVFLGFLVFLVFLSPLYSLCFWGFLCFLCFSALYTVCVSGFLVFLVFLSPTHRLYDLCFWGFLCFLCFSAPPTVYTSGFLGFLVFLVFPTVYTVWVSGVSCVSCFLCFSAPPTVYTVCVSGVSCVSCVSQPHPPCYATHENYVIDSDQSNELLETLLRDCRARARLFTISFPDLLQSENGKYWKTTCCKLWDCTELAACSAEDCSAGESPTYLQQRSQGGNAIWGRSFQVFNQV